MSAVPLYREILSTLRVAIWLVGVLKLTVCVGGDVNNNFPLVVK